MAAEEHLVERGQSIIKRLCPTPCEPSELEQVLVSRYGSSGGDSTDKHSLLFPGRQDKYCMRLAYDRNYVLVDIHSGPDLTDSELSEVIDLVAHDLYSEAEPKVGSAVCFSVLPVTEYFLRQNDFQIMPVPPDAPRPDFLIADHPFLLEVQIKGSRNAAVEIQRHLRRSREVELLLCVLLRGYIRSDRSKLRHSWVMPPADKNPPRLSPSVFWQVGYHYEGHKYLREHFSPTIGIPPMEICDPNEYYSRFGISLGQTLDLPATINAAIVAYNRLPSGIRRTFLTSCTWLQHSHEMFHFSHSASYLALVFAIETLLPKPKSEGLCDCCNREKRKGPTALFKEFLAEFAPAQGQANKRLGEFYRIRSKIVHEGGVLLSDRLLFGEMGFGDMEDWTLRYDLQHHVQVALLNWLHRHADR